MADQQKRSQAYTAAGVNIAAGGELVKRINKIIGTTHTRGVISEIGGFGGLFRPDLSRMEAPILVASTDGVGTKLRLAYDFNKHDTVGIDLVAMSANDILVQGATPLFFLDYFACGKLDLEICATVIQGIANGCKQAGCALIGGETAEMPDMYPDGEYDLAGFCVGLVDNSKLVDGSDITVGDQIIGIASSGIHSNGYSLVRRLLAKSGLKPEDTFPLSGDKTVADILLCPTMIYVEAVKPLLRDIHIKGMAHITGGGFYDNIPRILPVSVEARVRFGSWPVSSVFEWIKQTGDLTWPEMLQIFNCGIGFILILPGEQVEETINRIKAFNLNAWRIGSIAHRSKGANGKWGEQMVIEY